MKAWISDRVSDILIAVAEMPVIGPVICLLLGIYGMVKDSDMDN